MMLEKNLECITITNGYCRPKKEDGQTKCRAINTQITITFSTLVVQPHVNPLFTLTLLDAYFKVQVRMQSLNL